LLIQPLINEKAAIILNAPPIIIQVVEWIAGAWSRWLWISWFWLVKATAEFSFVFQSFPSHFFFRPSKSNA
jgi:hypothetical protein